MTSNISTIDRVVTRSQSTKNQVVTRSQAKRKCNQKPTRQQPPYQQPSKTVRQREKAPKAQVAIKSKQPPRKRGSKKAPVSSGKTTSAARAKKKANLLIEIGDNPTLDVNHNTASTIKSQAPIKPQEYVSAQQENPTGWEAFQSGSGHSQQILDTVERPSSEAALRSISRIGSSRSSNLGEVLPLPYCDPEQLSLIDAILKDPSFGYDIMVAHKNLAQSLPDLRNVNTELIGTYDAYAADIKQLESKLPVDHNFLQGDQSLEKERWESVLDNERWQHDIDMCEGDREAIFQRTIMMQAIDRYRLFRHKNPNATELCPYRFSVEKIWVCPSPPCRETSSQSKYPFPAPKPDLCVSFRTNAILAPKTMAQLPQDLKSLILPEGQDYPEKHRALPFVVIEAKKSNDALADHHTLCQCLNTATQALNNIYQFLRETHRPDKDTKNQYNKSEFEKAFFTKVRVFSMVATSKGILIRIHRARETADSTIDPNIPPPGASLAQRLAMQERPMEPRDPIVSGYPLAFEHDEFKKFANDDLDREEIVDAIEQIIWGYGPVLRDILLRAGLEIANQFKTGYKSYDDRNPEYYRHGQKHKNYRQRSSRGTSVASTVQQYIPLQPSATNGSDNHLSFTSNSSIIQNFQRSTVDSQAGSSKRSAPNESRGKSSKRTATSRGRRP